MTTATQTTRWLADLQRVMRFEEMGSDGFHRSWIMLFPEGQFDHPQYGDLTFSHQRLSEIKRLFDQRVRHIDIALDANHDQDKATGWLEQLQLRPAAANGTPAGLWGLVRWTSYGMQLLKDQLYRYFSPEFGPWTDPASGRKYDNVLIGGGLTNRPFLKEMPAVQLSDGSVSRKPWGSVDKSKLPRACFLDQGDPDHVDSWRLPVYEGAGEIGPDGKYSRRGPLNINAVRAALSALGGGRTGKAMTGVPSGVQAKLEGWLKKYGGKGSEGSRQASEPADEVEDQRMSKMFDDENENTQRLASSDDDEAEQYADGDEPDGDEDEGDESDGAEPDRNSDTHGAFEGRHSHGKYAMHSHDGDGDHSDAALKSSKGGKKMSERMSARQLREAFDQHTQQLAEMREQLYRKDLAETLAGWDAGKFQFSEAPAMSKGGAKLPMVALSKRFRDAYSSFMLNEGARLSTGERKKLNALVETALSAAVVDLSQRGASFDQEKRRTVRGGQQGQRAAIGDDVVELAEKYAQQSGKRFSELSYEEQLRLMVEAEREAGSSGLPF